MIVDKAILAVVESPSAFSKARGGLPEPLPRQRVGAVAYASDVEGPLRKRAHERALISSCCLHPTQQRCRGEETLSIDCVALVARLGHLLTTRICGCTQ